MTKKIAGTIGGSADPSTESSMTRTGRRGPGGGRRRSRSEGTVPTASPRRSRWRTAVCNGHRAVHRSAARRLVERGHAYESDEEGEARTRGVPHRRGDPLRGGRSLGSGVLVTARAGASAAATRAAPSPPRASPPRSRSRPRRSAPRRRCSRSTHPPPHRSSAPLRPRPSTRRLGPPPQLGGRTADLERLLEGDDAGGDGLHLLDRHAPEQAINSSMSARSGCTLRIRCMVFWSKIGPRMSMSSSKRRSSLALMMPCVWQLRHEAPAHDPVGEQEVPRSDRLHSRPLA